MLNKLGDFHIEAFSYIYPSTSHITAYILYMLLDSFEMIKWIMLRNGNWADLKIISSATRILLPVFAPLYTSVWDTNRDMCVQTSIQIRLSRLSWAICQGPASSTRLKQIDLFNFHKCLTVTNVFFSVLFLFFFTIFVVVVACLSFQYAHAN